MDGKLGNDMAVYANAAEAMVFLGQVAMEVDGVMEDDATVVEQLADDDSVALMEDALKVVFAVDEPMAVCSVDVQPAVVAECDLLYQLLPLLKE